MNYARFALGLAMRALAIGALAFLICYLWVLTQKYATSFVLMLIAGVIVIDLARVVRRTDATFSTLLDGIGAEGAEVPVARHAVFKTSLAAFERVDRALETKRFERQRKLEYQQALMDTVSAALIVLHSDSRAEMMNRAARRLTGAHVCRLDQVPVFAPEVSQAIDSMAAGARQIVQLTDGRQMLALAAQFSAPTSGSRRLISLQPMAGELDAIELKAWQDMARVLAHEMMNSLTPISSLSESLELLLRQALPDGANSESVSSEIAGALEAIKRRSLGLINFVERYRQVAELPQPKLREMHMAAFLASISNLMGAIFGLKRTRKSCGLRQGPPHICSKFGPG